LTGHNSLNWHFILRSFHYSLYARCILSWGRVLGPFGGLSTGQLMLPSPHGRKEGRPPRPNGKPPLKPNINTQWTYPEICGIFGPCHVHILTTLNMNMFNFHYLIRLLHSKYKQAKLLHKYGSSNHKYGINFFFKYDKHHITLSVTIITSVIY